MADRFPLVVIPEANQIQEIASTLGVTDNLRLNGGLKLIGSASNSSDIELSGGNDGETKITISGASSNVSKITILGKGGNVNNTNIAKFEMNGTNPIVKSFGSFEGNGITPIGGIIMWGGSVAGVPSGFKLCNGDSLSKSANNNEFLALFNALGYIHGGSGDNFNIPNLRDKFVVGAHADNSDTTYPQIKPGATGGSASSTGSHTHGYAFASKDDPVAIGNNFQSSGISNVTEHADINELSQSGNDDGSDLAGFTADTGSTGTNTGNLPPYYALSFIIRTN